MKILQYDFVGNVKVQTWLSKIKLAFQSHGVHNQEFKLNIAL